MTRVLFLCTGNSCRSQMAEGFLRALGGGAFAAQSAGTRPAGLHPKAVFVMAEVGIDISKHRSKSVDEFRDESFDLVVTVCDDARDSCPAFSGSERRLHWSLADPVLATGDEAAVLEEFRRTRDLIMGHVESLVRD